MDIIWDGITQAETLGRGDAQARSALADAAKTYNWPRLFEMISRHREFVNACRPDWKALFAPLHQAARSQGTMGSGYERSLHDALSVMFKLQE